MRLLVSYSSVDRSALDDPSGSRRGSDSGSTMKAAVRLSMAATAAVVSPNGMNATPA
jgi:hypothetical protein